MVLASLFGVCMAVARTVWFLLYLGCHRSAVSLSALNVSSLTQTIALMWGTRPLLQLTHLPMSDPGLLRLLFFPLVPHPTEFFIVLYILFLWSGTPVCSQLVFCMHVYVSRCIPNVSVERDVLHIHLLLLHLVHLSFPFFFPLDCKSGCLSEIFLFVFFFF